MELASSQSDGQNFKSEKNTLKLYAKSDLKAGNNFFFPKKCGGNNKKKKKTEKSLTEIRLEDLPSKIMRTKNRSACSSVDFDQK